MNSFVFDLDPVAFRLGPVAVRYYGLMFVVTLMVAFWFWRRQILRGGYGSALADKFIAWGAVATIAGARLGHCLFYQPDYYLSRPLEILYFWEGGLASHGATIGLILALFLFARVHKLRPLEIMDRFTMSAAVGAAGIRMGNFLNSEIVGRATDVPWAVRFTHDNIDRGTVARHPSQLYEFALGLLVLLALWLADRWAGREKRPLGLMTGLFLTLYFAARFVVEFFKEYQTPWERYLTMGQMLSIVPFLAGVGLLVWSYRHRNDPAPLAQPAKPQPTVKRRSRP